MKKAILFTLVAFLTLTATITAAEVLPAPIKKEKLDERSFLAYNDNAQPALVNLREIGFNYYMSLQLDNVSYCISPQSKLVLKLADGTEVTLTHRNGGDCNISAMYVVQVAESDIKELKRSPIKSVTMITDDGPIILNKAVDEQFFINCFK